MRGLFGVDRHPKSGVWRVRIEVPPHLRPRLAGKTSYTKTLNTKDEAEARRRAPPVQATFQRLIDQAQQALDDEAAGRTPSLSLTLETASAVIADWARSARQAISNAYWGEATNTSRAKHFPELGEDGPRGFRQQVYAGVVAGYRGDGDRFSPYPALDRLLRRIMEERGILVPEGGHRATKAAMDLLHGTIVELAKHQIEVQAGDWTLLPPQPAPPSAAPNAAIILPDGSARQQASEAGLATPSGRTLSVTAMLEAHIDKTKPRPTTESELRLAVRRLLAYLKVEDVEVHRITYEDAERFVPALRRLPKHMKPQDWARGIDALIDDYNNGRDPRPRLARPCASAASY